MLRHGLLALAIATTLAPVADASVDLVAVGGLEHDLVAALGAPTDIPAKLEGVAFGPDVRINGSLKHTLWVANDNDFVGSVTDALHPAGMDNPNLFFVFSVDSSELPGFEPQRFTASFPY